MECLRLLIENNQTNANLFRQNNGSKYAHNLIPIEESRPFALKIIEQLVVDGGHEDLGKIILSSPNRPCLIVSYFLERRSTTLTLSINL